MSSKSPEPQDKSKSDSPSKYEMFKTGLRRILSVPKKEIDRRKGDWQQQREEQKKLKKAS